MRQPGGQGWWGMVESYNEELHIVAHRQLHSSLAVVKAGPFSTEQWENLEAAFLSIVAWVEFATTSGSSLSTWTAPEPTKLRMEIETCKIGFWNGFPTWWWPSCGAFKGLGIWGSCGLLLACSISPFQFNFWQKSSHLPLPGTMI